jgi:glycosyltransferase involved in cell wall biosynthesis
VRGDESPPPEVRWRTELTARALARADALIAPSATFASMTAETYALARLPRVARNGRAAPARPAPEGRPAEFVFTAARLWDEGKNVALLDRAAARVKPAVIAAGPVRGPRGAQAEFRHLCTPGTLAAADVTALLDERPVYVSTSRYEPFGLPVLEAAQAGCALVLTAIPTFRELWSGAALFVDPDDAAALADAINGLLADPAERARLGAAAAERARRYNVPAMVQATLSAWGYPSGAVRVALPASSGSAA